MLFAIPNRTGQSSGPYRPPWNSYSAGLDSFKEIDPIALFEGNDGFLPILAPPYRPPQSLELSLTILGPDRQYFHLKESFDRFPDLALVGIEAYLEYQLIVLVL
jgi:hypothetical protein